MNDDEKTRLVATIVRQIIEPANKSGSAVEVLQLLTTIIAETLHWFQSMTDASAAEVDGTLTFLTNMVRQDLGNWEEPK